jgi:transcriptional regulator with XRE-family HTH domain
MSRHKRRILAKPRLRAERITQGWLMSDFARRIGISRAALSAIELRKRGVSERTAMLIVSVLHKDFDELFDDIIPDNETNVKEKDVVHTG